MTRVQITFRSQTPLLMNPATDEILENLRKRISLPRKTDQTREQEAEAKVSRDEKKRIGIKAQNLFSCLVEAGRLVKLTGKTNISTKESSLLPSFLSIEEIFLPFKGTPTWVADARRGRNPNGGEMVCIVRPRFDSWEFDATIEFDENEVGEATVRELVKKAGSKIGLCDFRPACRGQFGKFVVANWVNLSPETASRSVAGARNGHPVGA